MGEAPSALSADIEIECPFCKGLVAVSEEPPAVLHSDPMCEKFLKLEATAFLREVNNASERN